MSFLNASLIFGAVAAAVPIILHLISRREPQRVLFPAVRFLTQRIETNRSRLKVRRWLLLTFRALLLAALAVALAQPQIHREMATTWLTIAAVTFFGLALLGLALYSIGRNINRWLRWTLAAAGLLLMVISGLWTAVSIASGPPLSESQAGSAAIVIVIDNSARSGYHSAAGSRLSQMQEMGRWLFSRYPSESRLAVIDRSARPASFSLDQAAAVRTLDKLVPLQTTRPLSERIEAAVRLVRTSELPRRAVFVLSDLTRASWTPTDGSDSAAVLPPLLADEPRVALQVIDVGSEDRSNRWLGNIQLSDPTPARDVPVPLDVSVHVAEAMEETSVAAELQLYESTPGLPVIRDGELVLPDSRAVDRTAVKVRGGSPAELFFTLPPLDVGSHHGRIRLIGSDPLAIDDVRYLTVTVRPPSPVLLVGDDIDERRIFAQALVPFFEIDDPRSEYAVSRMRFDQVSDEAVQKSDAIVLLDPSSLPEHLETSLREWVFAGGRLFVALGPALKADMEAASPDVGRRDAGESTGSGDDSGPLWGRAKRVWRVPDPGSFLEVARPGHPVFSKLSQLPGGVPWSDFPVRQYWQIEPREDEFTVARFAGTFHGALIERPLGQGSVVTMTTPLPALTAPANQWNDLFSGTDAWPAFVLVQQLMEYLTGRDVGSQNVFVGDAVALPLLSTDSENEAVPSRLQMFSPAIPPTPVPVDGTMAVPGVVNVAGNYWLRGSGAVAGFSVNLLDTATELVRIDPRVLDDVLGEGNYDLARNREQVEVTDASHVAARPLYSQAMLFALALFLIEQILGNRFYAGSPSGPAGSPRWRRLTRSRQA
ncbi:MAG: BatA domain-containing protein [Pirellulaceae bacterium]